MNIHSVKEGEGIYEVAREYGVSPILLKEVNGIENGRKLSAGHRLLVPMPTRTYTVKRGDTLEKIAARFGTDTNTLFRLNPGIAHNGRLYDGETLAIKYADPTWGMSAGNGYFYRGCSKERLMLCMPYMSYVTICSARLDDRGLSFLFDDREAREYTIEGGKLPLLRIYCVYQDVPEGNRRLEVINDIAILAKSRGYGGVTLAGGKPTKDKVKQYGEFIIDARKKLMECDLALFCEGEADRDLPVAELFDGVILSYDKLHMENMPSFDEGERRAYTSYAEKYDASRSFIDLSAFGYCEGKFIPKEDILSLSERGRGEIIHNETTLVESRETGRKRKANILMESIDNIKAKFTLLSELGYMGISFDIARVPIRELFLFGTMYKVTDNVALFPDPNV